MRLLETLAKLCAIAAGLLLTAITLMTCGSLIGRNLLGRTIVGDFELVAAAAGAATPTQTVPEMSGWLPLTSSTS